MSRQTTLSTIAVLTALALVGLGCQQEKKTAAVLTPQPQSQAQIQAAAPAAAPVIPRDTTGKVIVHIVSRNQTITVKSGEHGVVYSIRDARGKLMLADATPAEFEQYDPQLFNQVRHYIAVQADPSGAIEASGMEPVPAAIDTVDSAAR
jgi:hypothetical protein